jgi:MFS family permease
MASTKLAEEPQMVINDMCKMVDHQEDSHDMADSFSFKARKTNQEKSTFSRDGLSIKEQIMVFLGILYCFLTTGVVTGFVALESVLVQEGVYANLCPSPIPNNEVNLSGPLETCKDQMLRLELMYTLASSALNLSCLLSGIFLDRFGMRWSIFAGACFMAVGSILFACGSPSFDSYIPGYVFIGFGGMPILLGHLRMAEMLSKHGGLFISAVSNAFDAAAFIFFLFKLAYDRWKPSIRVLFLIYANIPATLILFAFFMVPKEESIKHHAGPSSRSSSSVYAVSLPSSSSTSSIAQHHPNFKTQLLDIRLLVMVATMSFTVLRQEFYISSYPARMRLLAGDDVSALNLAILLFSILFPIAAIICTPVIGLLLDRLPLPWCFLVANLLGLVFDVMATLSFMWAQYVASTFLSMWRASIYSFVTAYYMYHFGYRHFGKLYGITFFTAAIVNLAQYGLNHAVQKSLQGNIFIIDYALITVGFLAILHSLLVFYWDRRR